MPSSTYENSRQRRLRHHVLLGTFCMMPMAYAAPMPMQEEEAMEMNMTPMVDVSSPLRTLHSCRSAEQQSDE